MSHNPTLEAFEQRMREAVEYGLNVSGHSTGGQPGRQYCPHPDPREATVAALVGAVMRTLPADPVFTAEPERLVEQMARAAHPALFGDRPDHAVGPATRQERGLARRDMRRALGALGLGVREAGTGPRTSPSVGGHR